MPRWAVPAMLRDLREHGELAERIAALETALGGGEK